ncbi:MAG: LysR family transcriptional regulator [Cypionkella sp.]
MFKFDGISAFVASVETGSISAASRRLGLAKSVVSERVAELERVLETKLLQRSTRKLSLTVDGAMFLPRAMTILQEAAEAQVELSQRRRTLVGSLRISAPVSFGILHLGPVINQFLSENKRVELTLDLDDRFVDVCSDGYDAVLRHGPITDKRLTAIHIASSRRLLVASPGYLEEAGIPTSVADIGRHRAILYANRDGDWRFGGPGKWTVVRPVAALRCNNGLMMREASLAGLGISLLPPFFVHEQLAKGSLVAIDVGNEAEGAEIFLAYLRDDRTPAMVMELAGYLKRHFRNPPWEQPLSG